MMEVDNRESRSLDWLVAVCHPSPDAIVQTELSPKSILLASYGTLSSDEQVRDMTAVILSASITVRRQNSYGLTPLNTGARSLGE